MEERGGATNLSRKKGRKVRTSEATRSPLSRVVISVAGALATEGGKDEAARIAPTRPRASDATLDSIVLNRRSPFV